MVLCNQTNSSKAACPRPSSQCMPGNRHGLVERSSHEQEVRRNLLDRLAHRGRGSLLVRRTQGESGIGRLRAITHPVTRRKTCFHVKKQTGCVLWTEGHVNQNSQGSRRGHCGSGETGRSANWQIASPSTSPRRSGGSTISSPPSKSTTGLYIPNRLRTVRKIVAMQQKLYKYIDIDPNGIGELSVLVQGEWEFVTASKEADAIVKTLNRVAGYIYTDYEHEGDGRMTVLYYVSKPTKGDN